MTMLHRKMWLRAVYYTGLLLFISEYGGIFGGRFAALAVLFTAYDLRTGRK